jgi:hypothetical protein
VHTVFVDNYLGLKEPDDSDASDAEDFDARWDTPNADWVALRRELDSYITAIQHNTDEIIVPTGQLFIEALPGTHLV